MELKEQLIKKFFPLSNVELMEKEGTITFQDNNNDSIIGFDLFWQFIEENIIKPYEQQLAELKKRNSYQTDIIKNLEIELEGANAFLGTIQKENSEARQDEKARICEMIGEMIEQYDHLIVANNNVIYGMQLVQMRLSENTAGRESQHKTELLKLSSELSACQLALASLQKKYLEDVEQDVYKAVVSREVGGQPDPSFVKEIGRVIKSFSKENDSNTPDFILAEYLNNCLNNFTTINRAREKWYGERITYIIANFPGLDINQSQ